MYVFQSNKFMPLYSLIDLNQSEFIFVLLRYSLGGDRPSQTTRHTLFYIIFNKL